MIFQSQIQVAPPVPWEHICFMDIQIGACEPPHPLPPGYVNGPIFRDYFTFQICTSGKGTLTCGDTTHTIEKGQCFVTFPNMVFLERAHDITPWSRLWVMLNGKQLGACFEALGFSPQNPIFPHPYNQYIETCLLDLVSSGYTSDILNQIYQLNCVCNMFMELSHLCGYTPTESAPESLPNNYVHAAIRYINTNYAKKLTISDIATSVGINRSYLYTLFKQQTGMSLQDYLISVRIKKACTFLSFPEASISNVAYSVGYEPLVFSKTFKQVMGVPPREYRKQILQKNADEKKRKMITSQGFLILAANVCQGANPILTAK